MRHLCLLLLILSDSLDPGHNESIAIRHDVADKLYLELGMKYPSVVRVGANGGDGTLIAPDWVLTAGHVAAGMVRRGGGTFLVFVDGHSEGYPVRQVIIHPDFEPMGSYDIALVRLEQPVKGVTPAGVYRKRDEMGRSITLVGHGDTKPGNGGEWKVDHQKRGATNSIDQVNDTHIVFDFDGPEEGTELEGIAGPGDSGGPAFIDVDGVPFIAGVSSLGEPGEHGPGTYGAREHYVRVSSHLKWIDTILSNPPEGRLVNVPEGERMISGRPEGAAGRADMPPGVLLLDEIGLMVKEREGKVHMVGRVDQRYPESLLKGGIRPPASVTRFNGKPIRSAMDLKKQFDAVEHGTKFTLEFDHGGRRTTFELVK